jgi:hypothetical protein
MTTEQGTAKKARAARYMRAANTFLMRRNGRKARMTRRVPRFCAGEWAALRRYERNFHFPPPDLCHTCGGVGWAFQANNEVSIVCVNRCPICGGLGRMPTATDELRSVAAGLWRRRTVESWNY